MSIFKSGIYYGISICDISTGDFYSTQIKLKENNFEKLLDEYARFSPSEIVINQEMQNSIKELNILNDRNKTFISSRNEETFEKDEEKILKSYSVFDGYDKLK